MLPIKGAHPHPTNKMYYTSHPAIVSKSAPAAGIQRADGSESSPESGYWAALAGGAGVVGSGLPQLCRIGPGFIAAGVSRVTGHTRVLERDLYDVETEDRSGDRTEEVTGPGRPPGEQAPPAIVAGWRLPHLPFCATGWALWCRQEPKGGSVRLPSCRSFRSFLRWSLSR